MLLLPYFYLPVAKNTEDHLFESAFFDESDDIV
jgi:hypothetical protein